MKTPQKYLNELKKGNLSEKLIGIVLYSINKRAKNYRDKIGAYRGNHSDFYDELNNQKMDELYMMKDDILNLFVPTKIHSVKRYTSPYLACRNYCGEYDDFCWQKEDSDYWIESPCNECKRKKVKTAYKRTDYFLFYEIGDHSFHSPIKDEEVSDWNLPMEEIESLLISGAKTKDLLSSQFCKKVHQHLMNNSDKQAS
jgi:hypothetical protein